MSEPIVVHIKSTVIDLILAQKYRSEVTDGVFTDISGNMHSENEIEEVCADVYEYSAEGELTVDEGTYTIRYNEPESVGMDNCETSIIVSEDSKETVTMSRTGSVSMACRFDSKDRRQLCCYETSVIPVEFFIQTRKVYHNIKSDGGSILLDYCIEIRGVNAERTKMFLEVYRR